MAEARLVGRRWALVVEDDELSRDDISRQLRKKGFTVLPSDTEAGAYLALAIVGPRIELVTTDQNLTADYERTGERLIPFFRRYAWRAVVVGVSSEAIAGVDIMIDKKDWRRNMFEEAGVFARLGI